MQVHEVRLVRLPHPSPAAVIAWPPHPPKGICGRCAYWERFARHELILFKEVNISWLLSGCMMIDSLHNWLHFISFLTSTKSIIAVHSIQFSGHFSGCAEGPRGRGESRVFQQRRDGRCAGIEQFRLLRDHVKNVTLSGTYQYTFWWLFCWSVVEPGVQQL